MICDLGFVICDLGFVIYPLSRDILEESKAGFIEIFGKFDNCQFECFFFELAKKKIVSRTEKRRERRGTK